MNTESISNLRGAAGQAPQAKRRGRPADKALHIVWAEVINGEVKIVCKYYEKKYDLKKMRFIDPWEYFPFLPVEPDDEEVFRAALQTLRSMYSDYEWRFAGHKYPDEKLWGENYALLFKGVKEVRL